MNQCTCDWISWPENKPKSSGYFIAALKVTSKEGPTNYSSAYAHYNSENKTWHLHNPIKKLDSDDVTKYVIAWMVGPATWLG